MTRHTSATAAPAAARRSRRTLTSAVAALAVAVTTLAGAGTDRADADTLSDGRAVPSFRSGINEGGAAATAVLSFTTWRGKDAGIVHAFAPKATWADVAVPDWFTRHWGGSRYRDRMLVTLGMLPDKDSTATLQKGAQGAYNAYFAEAGRDLVAAGMEESVVRLGHELNGSWFRWSAQKDPAAYAAYWRQAVGAMRSVPGQRFTFEWNVSVGVTGWDATRAWPGDAYVDYVGQDVYDTKWADPEATPELRWANKVVPTTGTFRHGLQFWADFAAKHGKPLAFSEWALVDKYAKQAGGSGGGGDNPYFVEKMHEWMARNHTAYETYFNLDAPDGKHRLSNPLFTNAASTYRHVFGPNGPTSYPALAQGETVGGTVVPAVNFPLSVSLSSERKSPQPLRNATLTGTVYIFASVKDVNRVRFYLDDPLLQHAPRMVDSAAAFDFAGTASTGRANPFSLSSLSKGKHTVTAVAEFKDGTQGAMHSTFTVQ